MVRCEKHLVFVFDLDKTIGYFTQIAIFIEGIEEYLQRNTVITINFLQDKIMCNKRL